jgi:DnaJ domain
LLANEALDILGLKSGASRAEIKEAYRDLVKVWHPDRFTEDSRLRQKAEDKLKHLNRAYQTLKSGAAESTPPTSSERTSPSPPPAYASAPRRTATASRRGLRPGPRFYILFAMLLAGLVGFAVYEIEPDRATIHATDPSPRAERSVRPPAPDDSQPKRGTSTVPTSGNDPSPSHIRALTDAETAQLQSACGGLQERPDSSAYQSCLRAQLAVITNAPGAPDLSSLSSVEHESIQSACSDGAALRSLATHDRCLTAQMAALAASPVRPDLSELSDADLASVESACVTAKTRGPAAYNRCRTRFSKLIASQR